MKKKYKKRLSRIIKSILLVLLIFHLLVFLIIFVFCFFYSFKNPPASSLMLYRKNISHFKNKPFCFMPLSRIPEDLVRMTLYLEDCNFYHHPGIDCSGIINAWQRNQVYGHKSFGGSTITQQLARTLFLIPHKSWFRKYLEILIALEIELFLTKSRILELYLNYAEWGKGIYGVNSAAHYYYGLPIDSLDRDKKACLVTVLSSPIRYTPHNFKQRRLLNYRYLKIRHAFLK